jgi:hypothetical protein
MITLMEGLQIDGSTLSAPATSGSFKLVEMQDGTLCISRNGIPIQNERWRAAEAGTAELRIQQLSSSFAAPATGYSA